MRVHRLLVISAVFGLLVACDNGQDQTQELSVVDEEQLHSGELTISASVPDAGPEERLQQFFEVLASDQPEQAAALVAKQPLQQSESELLNSLQQWAESVDNGQAIDILDSHQVGDYAIVRAQLDTPGAGSAKEAVRPVIMYQEEGEWRVVWNLLGLEPERATEFNPQAADRLEPLYDWYIQKQRTEVSEAAGGGLNS